MDSYSSHNIVLEINCFNGFQVTVEKRPLTHFYSQKSRALLIYLAVEAGRAHARSHLAGLLWPDYPEARARRNLSQTLTALRKDLGAAALLLQGTRRTIGLNHEAGVVVDVLVFERGLTAVRHHNHANPLTCSDCTQRLQQTSNLYSGSFLDQFTVDNSNLFENWLVTHRERLLQQAIDLLTRLGNSYATQGQIAAALETGQRLLALAPWQESAHRQRMLLLTQQGQRIQALAQYDILCDVLMAELGVTPASETDELYDRILAGEIKVAEGSEGETAVIPPPQPDTPFYAPAVSPHFVGREGELKQIRQLLAANGHKTNRIAIVGMGGIGKTTFAAYAAQQLKAQFSDGVLWGNSKTSDPHNVLDLWARAYGNDFSGIGDLESKAMAVRGMLANKETLVVIDNVEDAAMVRPLLPNCDRCVVLLTTRNLDIATSLNAQPVSMVELQPDMSQQLLRHILGEARLQSMEEEAAAAKIGQLLHHLPLAVEIAAKRLQSRPRMRLASLAQRLESVQQRLGLEISDQAVRASFQVSWEGLTALGKWVFAAMGVFGGRPFTVEALAAVAGLDLFDTEDELFTLTTLSLVNETGKTRYRQHPLLADFAAEKLANDAHELAKHQQRLVAYYLAFVQEVGQDYGRLGSEWDQLTAVIQTAHQRKQWDQVIDFAESLSPAWKARGRYTQARQAYRLAHDAAQKQANPAQETLILFRWGEASLEQNDYDVAQKRLQQSLIGYQQLEDRNGIAQTQYQLARIAIERNQFDKAILLLKESEKKLKSSPNKLGLGNILIQQGIIAFADGFRLDDAEPLFAEALTHYERAGNQIGKIEVLRLQAQVAFKRKHYIQAENLALQAKSLSEKLQTRSQLASNLFALTTIYVGQGKLELAKGYAEDSLVILRQTGSKRTEGLVLRQLSRVYKQTGHYQTALALSKESLAIFEALDIILSQAFSLCELAELHQLLDEFEEAQLAWQTAYRLAKQLNHQPLLNSIQSNLS